MRLLISIQGKYSLGARAGLMRGAPYRSSQVSVSVEGCVIAQQWPPPTVM